MVPNDSYQSALLLHALRSHSHPLSRCPFYLMDVINNGRPLLTPTPGHRKSQASRSGSRGVIIHIHIYTFKSHQVVYLPKHATGWGRGEKLTKKCGFDRSWRNPAWLSLLRVKNRIKWGKCISGRVCLDTGGRGRTEVTRKRERERERGAGKGWIQRLGHNEAHQAGWALRAVTCIGSSPFPNTSHCTAKPVSWTRLQNSFTVSIADPRKCRSREKEKVRKRGEKRSGDVKEWWRLTYKKYHPITMLFFSGEEMDSIFWILHFWADLFRIFWIWLSCSSKKLKQL